MNIIVICADTFRYDHQGFLKQQTVLTPNLDRLAAQSAVFSDFRLCSFPSVISRIDMHTGRYSFPFFRWRPLPHEYPVLAEVFKRHGFRTGFISDNRQLIEGNAGFERGFDFVRRVPGQSHDRFRPPSEPMLRCPCPAEKTELKERHLQRYLRNAFWYHQQGTNTTEVLFHAAMEWLETASADGKFLLWIDVMCPHQPWDPPAQFLNLYPWNEQGDRVFSPKTGYASTYPGADLDNMRSLYKASVSQLDHWIGQLHEHLCRTGAWDDCALLFCSDHGYYFGEHALLGKPSARQTRDATAFYEELAHLPLIIRHPDGLGAGRTIGGLCQPPDLVATALELAGITPVPWVQGNSLVPRLRGQPSRQSLAVAGTYPTKKALVGCLAVWTEQWCLMYSPFLGLAGSELFHRPTDPTELHNVITQQREVAQDLFDQLVGWLDRLGVSSRRKRQLLFNEGFPQLRKLQYDWSMLTKRVRYWKHYRHYARGG